MCAGSVCKVPSRTGNPPRKVEMVQILRLRLLGGKIGALIFEIILVNAYSWFLETACDARDSKCVVSFKTFI